MQPELLAKPSCHFEFPCRCGGAAGRRRQTDPIHHLDLDTAIQFRAFPLADPYRVVVDMPQVTFKLAPGTGNAGRGLVKAFRYGLVMPRRLADRVRSRGARQDRQFLCAGGRQRASRRGWCWSWRRSTAPASVQGLAPENRPELKPTIAEAKAAMPPEAASASQPTRPIRDR